MIYRFGMLTDSGEVYEGWAHNPEEMRVRAASQLPPKTDFEVFLTDVPDDCIDMSLERIRLLRAAGKLPHEDGKYYRSGEFAEASRL